MTLKRLMIVVGILVALLGGGIAWLWEYAYSPEGRARVIVAQLKGDKTSLRGWLLEHELIRPGYVFDVDAETARAKKEVQEELERESRIPNGPGFDSPGRLKDKLTAARRAAVADAIVKCGPKALPVVFEALQDDNHDLRTVAALVCEGMQDPSEIEPLCQCLKKFGPFGRYDLDTEAERDHHEFANQCVRVLLTLGRDAHRPLLEATRNAGSPLRRDVIEGICDQHPPETFEYLKELLGDKDESARACAAWELGILNDKRAVDLLIPHLDDTDFVANQTVDSLENFRDSKVTDALFKTLRDKKRKGELRISAAEVLAKTGQKEARDFLVNAIRNGDKDDRARAAEALGNAQIEGALSLLTQALQDEEERVQMRAVSALQRLGDARAIPALRMVRLRDHGMLGYEAGQAIKHLSHPPATRPQR